MEVIEQTQGSVLVVALQGRLDAASAGERRETGLPQTVGEADADARIDAQARQAATGKPQQPLPDVDPARAVSRLGTSIAAIAVEGKDVGPVLMLLQAYQQLAAANAVEQRRARLYPLARIHEVQLPIEHV